MSEDDQRARAHFEAGRSYFEEGAYDRAADEFRRAWELSRRPPLLINLATANERLGNYEGAIESLREYLRLVPDDPNRTTLERRIENLERLHRERQAQSAAPSTPPPEASPPSAPASSGSGPDAGLLGGALAGYGVAVVGGVLMAVFGAMALAEDAELRAGCGANASCTPQDVADADTFAAVSDVGLGLAIAGAAAGTVLLVLALGSDGGGERTALAPWLGPDGAGLAARLRF
ncbi:MAG TPA: tetratricopeptide repeat protein [Sandaracinaceae bacterium]